MVRSQFATITSLKLEDPALSDAFVIANFAYICSILNIDLNDVQKNDLLDEIGQVGWLTMADCKLFLDRMKKHKFYHRDYQELIVEFWKYADERLDRAFEIETSKHETLNRDDSEKTGETSVRDLTLFKLRYTPKGERL